MRICYVANGASIHTQRWVNYFARKGHEVHLICWKLMPGYDENIHVHWLTRLALKIWIVSRYLNVLLWIFQTRHLIKNIHPDIVDGHYVIGHGFLAACSGFHPLVITSWGSDMLIESKRNALMRFATRYALRKADVIVCLFPFDVAKEHITELGIDSDKIRPFVLGVDTAEFSPSEAYEKIRETLDIDRSRPIVISTRALAPIYDVETLVKAIPLVLAEVPQAAFVIAGTGRQQDYLEQLTRELGVSDNTRFIGWVRRTELSKYLSLADIYVSSSLSDGASVSLLEAMACELAPVVTDIPANRPWISEGENGFLFPVRDYKTLASKIINLLHNQEMREDFGRTSREIVQKKAEQQTEMEKMDSIYTELIKGG